LVPFAGSGLQQSQAHLLAPFARLLCQFNNLALFEILPSETLERPFDDALRSGVGFLPPRRDRHAELWNSGSRCVFFQHRNILWLHESSGYPAGKDYRHKITYLKGSSKTASELMPRVHLAVSLLKRWLLGTHQGGVSPEHLDAYLDEFTFRFDRRKSRRRGKLFYRLLEQAVAVEPLPYKSLIKCSAMPPF